MWRLCEGCKASDIGSRSELWSMKWTIRWPQRQGTMRTYRVVTKKYENFLNPVQGSNTVHRRTIMLERTNYQWRSENVLERQINAFWAVISVAVVRKVKIAITAGRKVINVKYSGYIAVSPEMAHLTYDNSLSECLLDSPCIIAYTGHFVSPDGMFDLIIM